MPAARARPAQGRPPARATTPPGTQALALAFDPHDVDIAEGTHRFKHDPLEAPQRALVDGASGINGHPLDWALVADPWLEDTLVAVRSDPDTPGPAAWFDGTRRLREETFHSPLVDRPWRPDTLLVRRLLHDTPYVVARCVDDIVQYTFDARTVKEPRRAAKTIAAHGRGHVLPASGAFRSENGEMPFLAVRVPFHGDRFARSTRKRFRLAVPGASGDTTVEGAAARILTARGYHVEAPRLLVALYRLLVGEVVALFWRDPLDIEQNGSPRHHPPGVDPLEATRRGLESIARTALGDGPDEVRRVGKALIESGHRPDGYRTYVERLARLAEDLGPDALAGCMEGVLRGHRALHADLVATHPGTRQAFLLEVKSKGDRLRPTQYESALWHARDGRCGYRLMKVDHA